MVKVTITVIDSYNKLLAVIPEFPLLTDQGITVILTDIDTKDTNIVRMTAPGPRDMDKDRNA